MLESLTQVAAILLLQRTDAPPNTRVYLRGVNDAKFRRQVVPGDRLRLEITLGKGRASLARAKATAHVGDQIVAEAELLLGIRPDQTEIDPSAIVHARATVGDGTVIGPHASIGPNVRIGANCRIGASAVVDGWTEIGDGTEIYPFASIGLAPQDLKYQGEPTRLAIGSRNIFREFVTINRGTRGGGYSVVTKDALPYARTVGSRPARIFGLNIIGLERRHVAPDVIEKLKRAFRYLLQSKLNTTAALQQIQQDRSLACAEVQYLLDFIRSSQRGVILRRANRKAEEVL